MVGMREVLMEKRIGILFGAMVFLFASCASIPTMELESARRAIMESEKVNASKYAPQELESSRQFYSMATNQVSLRKNKLAKESALKSKSAGDKAYVRSLEEFVKDQQETIQKSKEESLSSHADVAVPDKFNEALAFQEEAQKDMNRLKVEMAKLQQLQSSVTPVTNK
jgi:hypothetical protein